MVSGKGESRWLVFNSVLTLSMLPTKTIDAEALIEPRPRTKEPEAM